MNSVVCRRCAWQLSATGLCVLALVALGCAPQTPERVKSSTKPAAEKSQPSTPAAKASVESAKPAADTTKPAATGVTPAVEGAKPATEAAKPVADAAKPVAQAAKPMAAEGPALEAPAKPSAASEPAKAIAQNVPAPAVAQPTSSPAAKAAEAKPVVAEQAAKPESPADMKPYTEKIPGTDVKFDMVPIAGGEFTLGSPDGEKGRKNDEGPQVHVKVNPFWMGKCEVTWDEYELWGLGLDLQRRKVKNQQATEADKLADAVARPTKPYSDMTFGMGKEGFPAICMTQLAAKIYCNWLSAKTGHYYRLPTEAEWEYACRAGTKTAYSFGDDPAKLGEYAWSAANSDEKYHKIGLKKPNPWGLHDMHGNVSEWCSDQYVPDRYKALASSGKLVDSPLALGNTEYPRLVRGGAWTDEAPLLRSAARRGSSKEWKQQDPQIPQSIWYFTDADFVGFRVIRPLQKPTPEEAAKYDLDESQKASLIDYKKAQAGKE
jgi:formylglycine-generating enzyme required for sulfatase activity